jgi:AcrR family transcriptional regulator
MKHRMGLDQTNVVEAAARLIDEEGIAQLSLGHLARRLGVQTPSLYNHIAGLPGLKRDLAIYCMRDLLDRITRSTIGKARTEAIFAFVNAYRDYALENPGRYALTLQAPDPQDQELQTVAQRLIEVIQAVLAPYKLSDEDSIHAIRSLRSIVHGFISIEAAGGFGMPVNLDTSLHWMINLFITGLQDQRPT